MFLSARLSTTVVYLTLLFFTGCGACDRTARVTFDLADDDQTILFTTLAGDLMSLDRDSGHSTKLSSGEERFDSVVVSPDQKLVAATTLPAWSEKPEIVLFARDEQGALAESARFAGYLAAFGDSSEIYFAKGERWVSSTGFGGGFWTDYSIWKYSVEGEESQQLFTEKYFQIDGLCVDRARRQVYFSATCFADQKSDGVASLNLYRFDEASGQIEQFTASEEGFTSGSNPAISSDGQTVAFISDRGESYQYDLFTRQIDSDEATSLGTVQKFSFVSQPKFSSDGNRVYFLGVTDPGPNASYELWQWTSPDQLEPVMEQDAFRKAETASAQ